MTGIPRRIRYRRAMVQSWQSWLAAAAFVATLAGVDLREVRAGGA